MAFLRFADPTFRGGRFNDNALPVSLLPELSAYREIIIDVAKCLFLQSHPTRKRVPKGFVDSFQLVLRNVEPGSARPVLERFIPDNAQAMLPFLAHDFFARARDQVENAVVAASARHLLPNEFPRSVIPQFNKFGKGLRDGEYIELCGPEHANGPHYDRETRRHLILQYKPEYEDSIDLIAEIRGGVLDREQITFRLADGGLVDAIAPESVVQQVFPLVPSQVRLIGSGMFDQNNRLKSIIHIDELMTTEDDMPLPTPLDDRIAQIADLGEGWFEPNSPRFEPDVLGYFRDYLSDVLADGTIPAPFIYPTPEGNLQAEWSFPAWEVTLLLRPRDPIALLHATHLESDAERDIRLEIIPDGSIDDLRRFILECAE